MPDEDPRATPSGTTAQIVRMTQDTEALVQSLAPGVLVTSPPESKRAFLSQFLQAGGGQYVDVIGFHCYVSTPEEGGPDVDSVRAATAAFGQEGKPVFCTEGSWGGPNAQPPDLNSQAAFTARELLVLISKGIQRFYLFGWDIQDEGNLYARGTGVNPGGIAYQQVELWTEGALPTGACADAGTLWTCGYSRPNGYQALAVWDTSQTCTAQMCTSSPYDASAQFHQYRDLAGNLTQIDGGDPVPVGLKPVLLETQSAW
jgi:hypothetical protein